MRKKILLGGLILLMTTACGKRGALVYPDQLLPAAPSVLLLEQAEDKLRLTFSVPKRDRRDKPLQSPVQSMIMLKRTGCDATDQPFVYLRSFDASEPGFDSQIVWIDENVQPGDNCYQYRVGAVVKDEAFSSFRDTPVVTVHAPLAAPLITARPVFGSIVAIRLANQTEPSSSDSTLAGFRLYRADDISKDGFIPLGVLTSAADEYVDENVQTGKTYQYKARLIVKDKKSGIYRESGLSEVVSVVVQDAP